MKNILITGGAGYIGSHVCHLLIDKGLKVTCIDNLITGNKELLPKEVELKEYDIEDEEKVSKLILSNKFDLVMHFAGLIRVDESMKDPEKYQNYNYFKAKKFLETCFNNNLKKIIFSSTAAVYGDPREPYVNENDKTKPLNPYASSKLDLENFLIKSSSKYNSQYLILRYFNVAGADQKLRTGLISNFSTHLIKIVSEVAVGKREHMFINGDDYDTPDGTTIRDFIHVSDLADIHYLCARYIMEKKISDIFNCGYGKGFSVKEIINNFNNMLEKKIKYSVGPRRAGDSKILISNVDKIKKALNWRPKYNNLETILKSSLSWEKKLLSK